MPPNRKESFSRGEELSAMSHKDSGIGIIVANGKVLWRVESVLVSVRTMVGIRITHNNLGLYRGKLSTTSCLAFMGSSTCLAAPRYDCTPFESVSMSTDEEEAATIAVPASS